MTAPRIFSDEDLTAYLDGEADSDLSSAIDAALETDADLGARLAELDVPIAMIAQAFDAQLISAPPMPDIAAATPASANTNARPRWLWGMGTFGTGLAAGLAVALFTGLGTPEPAPRGWVSFVASYQALYTTATLATDDPSPEQAAQQLAKVSAAINLDLAALPQAQGLTFKRAQVLGFNGKPLVQIAYMRDDGTPVALCIIPAGPDPQTLNMGAAEGMDIARWNTPGFGFLLIGGQDAAPLAREAETFRDWAQETAT